MNATVVNDILVFIVVAIAGGGLCVWGSPHALVKLARHLRARSAALAAGRSAYETAWSESMETDL